MTNRTKNLIRLPLLAFVLLSVARFVVGEVGARRSALSAPELTSDQESAAGERYVVYYFHGNRRCTTCRHIEAWSEATVREAFAEDFESGRMVWRTVNVDDPSNAHYVEEFEMVLRTVLVAREVDGRAADWVELWEVWDLVGDREAFTRYVADQTRQFMESGDDE